MVTDKYKFASVDEQTEIAYLIGDYKPTDKPSEVIYNALDVTLLYYGQ